MKAIIKAVEYYLPETVLTNQELADLFPEWSVEKITDKTGIEKRHVVKEGECASDLAYKAAVRLFESGACSAQDIDFVLLCTQSPDYFLPTTACILQEKLKIPCSAGALDFNLGCSGFVYGLSLVKGLIETGQAGNVLLLTAETYSRYINPKDKGNRTLFGDGASATLVSASEQGKDFVGPFVFGTDGSGHKNLIVPAGASRMPYAKASLQDTTDANGNTRNDSNLYMNGGEIFAFTLRQVPLAVNALLEKTGKKLDDIDFFVFHQANTFMLDFLRKKSKIPTEKFIVDLKEYGNTVSSSIPVALKNLMCDSGRDCRKKTIMLVGFGVGYSWSACLVELH
ncbi:MAG: ketoacyl-ACP synthase III [Elusimicrobia bacterium]|nr:ketoacyl-ACP synthase III [Elusimicrobiota bacterium]